MTYLQTYLKLNMKDQTAKMLSLSSKIIKFKCKKEPDAKGIGFFYEEEYIMNQIRKEE